MQNKWKWKCWTTHTHTKKKNQNPYRKLRWFHSHHTKFNYCCTYVSIVRKYENNNKQNVSSTCYIHIWKMKILYSIKLRFFHPLGNELSKFLFIHVKFTVHFTSNWKQRAYDSYSASQFHWSKKFTLFDI